MHTEVQVTSECLSHDGSERTTDQLQRVLELNAVVLDLHLLVLGGENDFESFVGHCHDEFHDKCEVIVRYIVEVHWQSIVLLVERELQIAFGTTGENVLSGFEEACASLPCRVFTCHMCMMSHLVVFQFLATEWTHGCGTIISLDLETVLER